jgi:hypothetical protein
MHNPSNFEPEKPMPKRKITFDPELATEAKSLVALAFRNGPIEYVHAGKECPVCAGKPEYSHITQDEMRNIMKAAVDTVYKLLWLKQNDPEKYAETLEYGDRCTNLWDDPRLHVNVRDNPSLFVRIIPSLLG